MGDHEALFNGLQNPGILTSYSKLFFALYWLHLVVGEAVCPAGLWAKTLAPPHQCLASTSARKQHHLPLHFTRPLTLITPGTF